MDKIAKKNLHTDMFQIPCVCSQTAQQWDVHHDHTNRTIHFHPVSQITHIKNKHPYNKMIPNGYKTSSVLTPHTLCIWVNSLFSAPLKLVVSCGCEDQTIPCCSWAHLCVDPHWYRNWNNHQTLLHFPLLQNNMLMCYWIYLHNNLYFFSRPGKCVRTVFQLSFYGNTKMKEVTVRFVFLHRSVRLQSLKQVCLKFITQNHRATIIHHFHEYF